MTIPSLALVKRELLSNLRRVRSFLCLALFVGFLIGVVGMTWTESASMAASARFSEELIVSIFMVMLGGCAFFVPAFASGAIISEKEQQTYDLLRHTLIKPSGIIISKLLNTVGYFLLLVFACLPIFSVALFGVGIDLSQIINAFGMILITTISCAMAGIFCSAYFKRSITAIIGSYLGMLWLMGAPLLFIWFGAFMVRYGGPEFLLEQLAPILSPPLTLYLVCTEGINPGLNLSYVQYISSLFYQFFWIVFCYSATLFVLRRPSEPPKVTQEKPIDDKKILRARRSSFPFYLIDPLRRKPPIGDNRNPMMIKEVRWGLTNRGTILIRIFYVALVFYFFLGLAGADSFRDSGNWIIFQIIATLIVAPALMEKFLCLLFAQKREESSSVRGRGSEKWQSNSRFP